MSKYIQATQFRVKEGRLEDARAQLRRVAEAYREAGNEVRFYLHIGGGLSGDAMMTVEFPDGTAWLSTIEDPRLMELRERMNDADWPMLPATSSIWQELEPQD